MNDAPDRIGKIARSWWGRLVGSDGVKRAARAKLRRCATPFEAFTIHETLELVRDLRVVNHDRAAMLAMVLAHVKEETPEKFARALGRRTFGEKDSAVMSEARFRRLLQAEDDEVMEQFRRAVRLLGGSANPGSIARTLIFWNDEETRKRLIFDYYNVTSDAPPAPTQSCLAVIPAKAGTHGSAGTGLND